MSTDSTRSMGQQAAILRTQKKLADEIHGGQIRDAKKQPLNRKDLQSAQGASNAPMG